MLRMTISTRTLGEAERREQILAAARAVFVEKGYELATVSAIVRRAGVAQGTFYLYFESKKDIVIALARRPMELVTQRLRAEISTAPSFEQALRIMVRTAFAVSRDYPDLCRLMHMGGDSMAEAKKTAEGKDMRAMGVMMFQQAGESGQMQDIEPGIAFDLFHSLMSGAMQACVTDCDDERALAIASATEDTVVRAFVKKS
jgi:AcrR family transcriptional regulator